MVCPNCKSQRIQLAYEEAGFVMRLVGGRRVLCNGCGHVFSAFDPLARAKRAPTKHVHEFPARRRGPRFPAHLPAAISLVEANQNGGKASYSEPSRGHCEVISQFGMGISFIGTKFPEDKLTRMGTLLFVRIELPTGSIEAVVAIRNHVRIGEERKRRWFLGVEIYQIPDADRQRLAAYVAQRQSSVQHIVWD